MTLTLCNKIAFHIISLWLKKEFPRNKTAIFLKSTAFKRIAAKEALAKCE